MREPRVLPFYRIFFSFRFFFFFFQLKLLEEILERFATISRVVVRVK